MFWENFLRLCNKNEEKPNQVAKKIGIPSGSITNWKNGMAPRSSTALKIADYFGVTVDELLGEEPATASKEKAPAKAKAADPYEEKLLEDFRACDIEGRMAVLGTARTERVRTEKKAEGLA